MSADRLDGGRASDGGRLGPRPLTGPGPLTGSTAGPWAAAGDRPETAEASRLGPPELVSLPGTVGIVGAGTMGCGIAQLALEHGHDVVLYDVDGTAIRRGRHRIADGLARRVAKGGLEDEAAAEAVGTAFDRLRDAHALEDVAGQADLVIEAALEDLGLKKTLFRALDAAAAPAVPLATNTSALSVSAIGGVASRPERVVGMHFFNPAPLMPLVEVVRAERTDPAAVAAAAGLAASWGKTPIVVRDAPGFVVNRVNRPFTLEPLSMLAAGEAGIERIDAAIGAAGFPMGPFAYMDLVGLDVNLAVAEALFGAFDGAARFEPSPIQRSLVAAGALGRKTGAGFYEYGGSGERLGPAEPFAAGARESRLPDEAIVERIVLAIVDEAYRALGEGLAARADIDLAMRLGARHPLGPFEWAAQRGEAEVWARLVDLASVLGERFEPARALREAVSAS